MTDAASLPERGEKVRIPASGSTATVIGHGRGGLLLLQVDESHEMIWTDPGHVALIATWYERKAPR